MIRVFCAAAGGLTAARASTTPVLEATEPADLLKLLEEPGCGLDQRERAAVRSAVTKDLRAGDIFVAAGGDLYHVERHRAPPLPAPKREPEATAQAPTDWATAERGARVLVLGREPKELRLAELLAFLGYDAATAGQETDGLAVIAAAIGARAPHLVLVPDRVLARLGAPLISSCRDEGSAVVVVQNGTHDAGASSPSAFAGQEGVGLFLAQPIHAQTLARRLDPVILAARKARVSAI